MAPPDKFQRNLAKLAKRIEDNAEATVKRAAVVADQVVVVATPVDTGRARGGWQVAIDRPATGPTSDDKDGNDTIARARSIIEGFSIRLHGAIHITNNVSYIQDLENGTSAQAPQGMTRQAVLAARRVIESAKLLRGQ